MIKLLFAGWMGLAAIGYFYIFTYHPEPEARKPENVEILRKVANERFKEREAQYDFALSQGNKGVACKFAREMVFWANETHDVEVFNTAKGKMIGVCGYE